MTCPITANLRGFGRTICAAILSAISLLCMPLASLHGQERPAQRVASIVSVAVAEYALGVDERGRLISDLEYNEAVSFLGDAREVAERLSGEKAELVRSLLDSLSVAVASRRPPSALAVMHAEFMQALGADAALDMPSRQLDIAEGRALYQANCASCHGSTGMGDGPSPYSCSRNASGLTSCSKCSAMKPRSGPRAIGRSS